MINPDIKKSAQLNGINVNNRESQVREVLDIIEKMAETQPEVAEHFLMRLLALLPKS